MAKKRAGRKKPQISVMPSSWDMGADGPANQAGLIVEDRPFIEAETGKQINPNGIRGSRREIKIHAYYRRGKIDARQLNAAIALYQSWEGRVATDPLAAIRIDRQSFAPDPMAALVDGRDLYRIMWAACPAECRRVVQVVVLDDQWIRHTSPNASGQAVARAHDNLCIGLNAMADAISG